MNYQQLLDQIKQQVLSYFKLRNNEALLYHNRKHTENVVAAAIQIANHYQLNDQEFFTVTAAAWFHDVGYMEDKNNHEEHSARLAEDFLKAHYLDDAVIEEIKGCIMATKMPQQPVGLLQSIVCDADVFHLGTADFNENNKQMRKECKAAFNWDFSKQEWRQKTIKFMQMHHYHTDYAKMLLDDQKAKNLQELKNKADNWEEKSKEDKEDKKEKASVTVTIESKPNAGEAHDVYTEKDVKKKDRPEKGIETMFRVSSSNHQRLSDMADNKAHIMITVNSIILSAIISLLLRRLEDYSYLIIPTFIILMVSLTTMIFAILATRPSIPEGRFTPQDVDDKKVNLLFFGNFYRMNLQEYIAGMRNVMADREYLYGSLIIDVYSQGVVLGRKYRLLRISYNIFMFGLIASVLAFILASSIAGSGKH
ncbi:Pycsar system effector family protein [Mucilaginibacter terrae]|uniref:Metal-dependent HD superfamily phosphohydrolase n=1 Tax=Mucilaginibacter terrae TaxID=1955052 RepID=A0ABU3GY40_9SPHI|nr:Pycsar system effector family protein [Mucilaginibacter terrae]MDT3404683.1 putative metal-dependent HD superfamily phosphohydrolase [Mucilaginibacter terrae]